MRLRLRLRLGLNKAGAEQIFQSQALRCGLWSGKDWIKKLSILLHRWASKIAEMSCRWEDSLDLLRSTGSKGETQIHTVHPVKMNNANNHYGKVKPVKPDAVLSHRLCKLWKWRFYPSPKLSADCGQSQHFIFVFFLQSYLKKWNRLNLKKKLVRKHF